VISVTTTKPLAAVRQLDVAIDLLFGDKDPLAIRTLTGAAHQIFSDLVESKDPGQSWRQKMIKDSGLTPEAATKVINGAQNFLKHGDRDPNGVLTFMEDENDHLIFFATIECGTARQRLSIRMQAFQIWYLASYPANIGHETEPVKKAKQAFPGLEDLGREERLARGAAFLRKLEEDEPGRFNNV
jgi:hypothetical protein